MIIVPHEQLAKQIPASNRIPSGNRAEKDLHPLLEGAEHGFNQTPFPETLRAQTLNQGFSEH